MLDNDNDKDHDYDLKREIINKKISHHEEHEKPCLWLGKHEACHAESVVVNLLITKA